jgi:hypothetical protein
MPSTFSPLKIELPATGEQSGTWGNTTNTNLGTALEEAITGSANVTFASGNVVLTLTDTNASQVARNLRLNLIGVTGGSTRTLTVPAIKKLYLVSNNCADSVIVGNSTGATVTVPAGNNIFVYNDGTDVLNAITYITNLNAVAVSAGTVTTTQVDIASQGDLRLQDTTGGQYVALQAPGTIATSYTLTLPVDDGTNGQALITDGNGVLSWSTAASGDVYGPASATDNAIARFDLTTGKIIQNSVVTIADTTGDMAGVGTLSSGAITTTGVLTVPAGTVSAPAITTTGDTNTGIFFPAADTIAFTEGGVESMRINSSGFVGIGTNSPTTKLQVSGSDFPTAATVTSTTNGGRGVGNFNAKTGAGADISLTVGSYGDAGDIQQIIGTGQLNLRSGTSQPIVFQTSGSTERMRIDSSGNVGIGTSSPASAYGFARSLGVSAATSEVYVEGTNGKWSFGTDGNGNAYIQGPTPAASTAGTLAFSTRGSQRMLLDASGNLGLGVTPSAWGTSIRSLDIGFGTALTNANSSTDTWLSSNAYYTTQWLYKNTANASYYQQISGTHRWHTAPSGTAGNAITFTQAMTLDASGNLGIGTTSPGGNATNRSVRATGTTSSQVQAQSSATSITIYADGSQGILDVAGAFPLNFVTNSVERMRIASNGNVSIGTTVTDQRFTVHSSAATSSTPFANPLIQVRANGGNADGSIQFTDTAVYNSYIGAGGGSMYFATNGTTERMRIDSSGNVLVGTTSATSKLTSSAGAADGATGYAGAFHANKGATGDAWIQLGGARSDGLGASRVSFINAAGAGGTGKLAFQIEGTERMRISSAGFVGIGTSSPGQPLSIAASINAQLSLDRIGGGQTGILFKSNGSDRYIIGNDLNAATVQNFFIYDTPGGVSRFLIDSAGNVGIGTSSPTQRLHVETASGNCYIRSQRANQTTGQAGLAIGGGTSSTDWLIYMPTSSDNLVFFGNSSDRMTITSAGNVGIGTSSPAQRLHVVAADGVTNCRFAGASFAVRIQSLAGVGAVLEGTSNTEATYQPLLVGGSQIQFTTSGTERMRIDSSGNVGIGTASPSSRLTMSGATANTNGIHMRAAGWDSVARAGLNGTVGGDFILSCNWNAQANTVDSTNASAAITISANSGIITFGTGGANTVPTERMRITSAGNVSIGTTSSGGKLTVNDGNINVNWGGGYFNSLDRGITILAGGYNDTTNKARVVQIGGVGDNNNRCGWTSYSIKTNGVGNGAEYYIRPVTWTGTAFAEQASAGVYLTDNATSWSSASDERLKDIIEPITDAANKVSTLRAVIGKYKTDEEGTRRSFLIAQDVQKVLPEAVNKQKDETLGIQYTDVIPLLVAAIQEQQTLINQLTTRLNALEGK